MQEKEQLVRMLTSLYHEIRPIEQQWGIQVTQNDHRPRIERFHDAVRALTSGTADPYAKDSRLAVEKLAIDVQYLRHIQALPMGDASNKAPSSKTDIVTKQMADDRPASRREAKTALAEHYKHYTVIFVALFHDPADYNYQTRMEDNNQQVEDMATLVKLMEGLIQGQAQQAEIEHLADELDNAELRQKIANLLAQQSGQVRDNAASVIADLQTHIADIDQELQKMNAAHMNYATAQLAVYEQSKDLVKKMVAQGLNVLGRFAEQAMAQGQGQGLGR
jgi:hypothetical protein